jgi:HlyD family secretion protein
MTQQKRGFKWKVWSFLGIVVAGILTIAGYFLSKEIITNRAHAQESKIIPEKRDEIHVEVINPRKGQMDRTSSQPGSVQAFESVQLYAGVSGYLKTMKVDIGDAVTKGQVLAVVDVPELEQQVHRYASMLDQARARVLQTQARVTSCKAELDEAKTMVPQAEATAKSKAAELRFRQKQLERMKDLFATKSIDERLVDEKMEQRDAAKEAEIAANEMIISIKARVASTAAKVQQAQADEQEANAEVKVAQAELEKAQVYVRFATIVAPFDGVVTLRNFFPGDFVRAANEGGAHAALLTVQRIDLMRIIVQIPDRDVPYCDPGDPAVIELDALPGRSFQAKVSRISRSEDRDTRLMHVEIDVPNSDGKICNGMYGKVTILLEKSSLLSIPAACLVGKEQERKGTVYVVEKGLASLRTISFSTDNGQQIGILKGLSENDQVIVRPGSGIREGSPVIISSPQTSLKNEHKH